jgi:CO/xanthine dehydrogenase Mo-binding subunit
MDNLPNISFVGRSISRREDQRLLTGRGKFIADLKLPQMLYAAFVRSPLAHARIKAIDVSPAAASPGIIYALSGLELPGNCRQSRIPSSRCRANGQHWCSTSLSIRNNRCLLMTRSGTLVKLSR